MDAGTSELEHENTQKFVTDLVGQTSLLTPATFTERFLTMSGIDQGNFIKYGWREAIEEALKKKYGARGKRLWHLMVTKYPDQFSGRGPSSKKARKLALSNFRPTKQDREEEWAKRNAPNLQRKLEKLVPGLFPTVLLGIISEYAVTWIAFIRGPPQKQLTPQGGEHVHKQLEALMNEGRYEEVIEISDSLEKDERERHLFPLITTIEQCQYFIGYLESRDMLPSFLVHKDIELVKKVVEFENMDSDYYIKWNYMHDAMVLLLKEDRHDRVLKLVESVQKRYAAEDEQCRQRGETPPSNRFMSYLVDELTFQEGPCTAKTLSYPLK